MKIDTEIIEKLQPLKGMNLDVAFTIFREKKLDVKRRGFVENVIALLIDRDLPRNIIGMDFPELFEVKEIKVHFTKRKSEMRTGGDTAISEYVPSETEYIKSNIWDKTKSLLIVCVDENRIVVDIRFLNGLELVDDMIKDYEGIKVSKNLCRKNNNILVFKTGRNSIMLKGNTAITKSKSIIFDGNEKFEVLDQDYYIRELFNPKFIAYRQRLINSVEAVKSILKNGKISRVDLIDIMSLCQTMIEQSSDINIDSGSELPF